MLKNVLNLAAELRAGRGPVRGSGNSLRDPEGHQRGSTVRQSSRQGCVSARCSSNTAEAYTQSARSAEPGREQRNSASDVGRAEEWQDSFESWN